MKLLYFYTEFWDEQGNPKPFRGMDRIELNLSAEDRFRYDKSTDTLQRTLRNTPLPEDFWANEVAKTVGGPAPSKITNVNVIAGENGSGKSTVMQYVIDLLDAVYGALTHRDWKTEIRHDPRPNRSIVIMEDTSRNGGNPKSDDAEQQWYIFDYAPKGSRKKKINLSDDFLRNRTNAYRFSFCNWKHLSETQSPQGYRRGEAAEARNGIKRLLERTKLIYMTNTLTQRDLALDMSKESDSPLRDYFVYDCSLGAAIGPNAAQFFPYEVYKQVKYVFDRKQYRLRRSLEERIPALRIPRTLRLRPRIQALRHQSDSWMGDEFRDLLHLSGNEDMSDGSGLAGILGVLCVAAYESNMSRHMYKPYRPIKDNGQQFENGEDDSNLERLKESINAICAATGPILVTGTKTGELFAWDSATGQHMHREKEYYGCVNSLDVLGDGSIAIGSKAGVFRLSNLLTNRRLQKFGKYLFNMYCTTGLPDGRIACADINDKIFILDFDARDQKVIEVHEECVNDIICLPNGHIVTASDDGTLCVLDPDSNNPLQRLEGHFGKVKCVVVLPDGRIASGSSAGEVYVWDLGTGECLQWVYRSSGVVNCMAVLPDGRIVGGSNDGVIRIWDPDRMKIWDPDRWDSNTEGCLWELQGHSARITCVAVLADGRIVSGSDDRNVRIWDPNTGKCLHRLKGHSGSVTCIHVLGDGRIASGSEDGYVRIWDPDSGACVQTLKGHSGQVNCIASVPNPFATALKNFCLDYLEFLWAHREDLLACFHRTRDGSAYELDLNQAVNGESGDGLYALLAEFMEKYRYTCEPEYTIDFDWGLSSGEENMLRLFSNLYHVFDRDYNIKENGPCAIYNNEKHLSAQKLTTPCDTVLLFLDEADLTLHPEWQRTLIHILTAFLPRIYPAPVTKEMQIILSSHSPLLLGDIPGENVTYLKAGNQLDSEEKTWVPGETFGQNIHTLLKESFFLKEGTVGEFAAAKINAAAQRLQEIGDRREITEPGEMEDLRKTVALTAPGILRTGLEQLLRRAEQAIGYNRQQTEVDWLIDEINRLTPEAWDRLCQARKKKEDSHD